MPETPPPPEPPSASSTDALIPTPLTRRAQAAPERPPLPPDIEEQFRHLTQAVQALSTHFMGEPAAPLESSRERAARRVKKFHRATGEERAATPGGSDETPTGLSPDDPAGTAADGDAEERLALNKNIAWPRQNLTDSRSAVGSAMRPWWRSRSGVPLRAIIPPFAFILLLAGYYLGQSNGRFVDHGRGRRFGPTAADLFGESELTDRAARTANEALHAEHAGDAEGARKIYENALAKRVPLPGANYRLAILAIEHNDRLNAEEYLDRSLNDGEAVEQCRYVLARLAADKGDFEEAATQLERATRAQPFEGKSFFYWAETLRRLGKPQAALIAFEQALDRAYTPESGDLYLFKSRLAKVEYGRDDAFNADLASHLKQTPVAGEWLLLAAAQDLDKQSFPAAANRLQEAANVLPAALYAALTHDYFFQAFAKRPEVTSWLNRSAPLEISSAGPTVLDPGIWLPERGDPALWTSASNASGH